MSEPIRVLQVLSRMDRGGAETMIMNMYRNIDRNHIQFDFVVHTNDKCAFDDEIIKLGGRFFHAPRYIGTNHFQYKKWWDSFFELHPEYMIVHSHVRSTANIILSVAKKNGRTTIAHSHNTSNGTGLAAMVKKMLQHRITKYADYCIACSEAAGKWLFGNAPFVVMNNAIDTKAFKFDLSVRRKTRDELGIREEMLVVGHIGSFKEQKNHSFIVKIFHKVIERHPNSRLLLVGDGQLKSAIEAEVADLGLTDAVLFTGVREDVSNLMQAMDVFLFPSLFEGLPVTLIEAQAAGLPCIIADTITREVKVTDLITPLSLSKEVEAWASQVLAYTDAYERPDTQKEIVRAGYDAQETVKWLEEFYFRLLYKDGRKAAI